MEIHFLKWFLHPKDTKNNPKSKKFLIMYLLVLFFPKKGKRYTGSFIVIFERL